MSHVEHRCKVPGGSRTRQKDSRPTKKPSKRRGRKDEPRKREDDEPRKRNDSTIWPVGNTGTVWDFI